MGAPGGNRRVRICLTGGLLAAIALLAPLAHAGLQLASTDHAVATLAVDGFPKFDNGQQATWSWSLNRTSGTITVQNGLIETTYPRVAHLNATGASSLWVKVQTDGAMVNPAMVNRLHVDLANATHTVRQVTFTGGAYTQTAGTLVEVPPGGELRLQVTVRRASVLGPAPEAPLQVLVYDTPDATRGGPLKFKLVH